MQTSLICECGVRTPVIAGGKPPEKCPACARAFPVSSLPTPSTTAPAGKTAAKTGASSSGNTSFCELIRDTEGREWWKMTCVCGKRVRTPGRANQPYGKCPQCGTRLKLPGASKPLLVSAAPGQKPVAVPSPLSTSPQKAPMASDSSIVESDPLSETRPVSTLREDQIPLLVDDETETVAVEAVIADMHLTQDTIQRVAARLRPAPMPSGSESTGRISAWPLAGLGRRALAGFIDVTLAVLFAGFIAVLGSADILPQAFLRAEVLFVLFILAGWMNDGVLQLLTGETVGKKLVVIVTRTLDGGELSVRALMLRALLKWLIVPGWLIACIDPNERALHDLICRTLVLKGRAKRPTSTKSSTDE